MFHFQRMRFGSGSKRFFVTLSTAACVTAAAAVLSASEARCEEDSEKENALAKYRPNAAQYIRIDSYLHEKPEYASFRDNHALHETLKGDKLIQNYEIYKRSDANELFCIVSYGNALNGYRGIVHGGANSQ